MPDLNFTLTQQPGGQWRIEGEQRESRPRGKKLRERKAERAFVFPRDFGLLPVEAQEEIVRFAIPFIFELD